MDFKELTDLGLNKYQAEVLFSLLKLKEAKASEIAKSTSIDRVRVYDILDELYSMGLIHKLESRPTIFLSLPPSEIFQKALQWNKSQFQERKEKILEKQKNLQKELSQLYESSDKEKPSNILELISLGDVSEKETKKIISQSKKTIKIMTEVFEYIDSIEDILSKSKSKILVLLKSKPSSPELQSKAVKKLKSLGAQIRYTDSLPLRGTIIDNKKAILNVRDVRSSNLLRDCIYTNHQSFLEAANIYFDNLWTSAKK